MYRRCSSILPVDAVLGLEHSAEANHIAAACGGLEGFDGEVDGNGGVEEHQERRRAAHVNLRTEPTARVDDAAPNSHSTSISITTASDRSFIALAFSQQPCTES